MRFHNIKRPFALCFIIVVLFFGTYRANAVTFNLIADSISVTMPDGTAVTMWAFGLQGQSPTVPGPILEVPSGDSQLVINLTNNLPEPVSIIIPSQPSTYSPVTFIDARGRTRVRSFTSETASGDTRTYSWNNIRPGTCIYESGSHLSVQVQMGLYGAVVKDEAAGQIYNGISYDKEVILIFSEVDPDFHQAVVSGTYGTPAYPSAMRYSPKYFLINGQPYPYAAPIIDGVIGLGQRVLVRFLNAGIQTHVPVIDGRYFDVVAEDGNPYTYVKTKYTVFLPAGKTKDVIFTPAAAGSYPIYDRRFFLTNDNMAPGGMLAYLTVVEPCQGDIDGDGDVDAADLAALLGKFGQTCTGCPEDLNGDGKVDIADAILLVSNYGRTNCP